MESRLLVNENLEPALVAVLRSRGYEATHVQETLGNGVIDDEIARYVNETDTFSSRTIAISSTTLDFRTSRYSY